jgi:ankyrin repeat protein
VGLRLGAFLVGITGTVAAVSSMAGFGQAPPASRRSTDPPLPARGKLGQELFLAIDHRDLSQVQALLAKGADPNARNGLEFTPIYIAAASHQTDVMQALLKAGADNAAQTTYGTPLSFAAMGGNVDGAKLLLGQGVKCDIPRTDGLTPLMLAANIGVTPIVADLIERKVNVDSQDQGGETALALAARGGYLDTATVLVAAGADVNLDDAQGETPLMQAAMAGHGDVVGLLLSHGAHPNATDGSGRTALILSASYGDYPDVIKALRKGGAKTGIRNEKGQLAASIATRHGYSGTAVALAGSYRPAPVTLTVRDALKRSLASIQSSTTLFCTEAKCVSCHHEGIGRIVTGEAASNGIRLDPELQKMESARLGGMLSAMLPLHKAALRSAEVMKQLPLIEINEVSDADSWFLSGMAANGQPRTEATGAMAMCLARQQLPSGCWTISLPRVPLQSSAFTFTALAAHSLTVYGPESYGQEVRQRIALARNWLLNTKPQSSEDRASRLLGLKWCAADPNSCAKATTDILADQRSDGGWSQLPGGHSDAYSTGQALYALRVGGKLSTTDPAWKRGLRFLLQTQDDDGTWFVNKRAIPANNYFSTGFPHGESQYSSFDGTCWATLALLQAVGDSRA